MGKETMPLCKALKAECVADATQENSSCQTPNKNATNMYEEGRENHIFRNTLRLDCIWVKAAIGTHSTHNVATGQSFYGFLLNW